MVSGSGSGFKVWRLGGFGALRIHGPCFRLWGLRLGVVGTRDGGELNVKHLENEDWSRRLIGM